ncbi:MAG: class I SAM-dependent methyltransferase [Marmoricola sp.]
MSTSTSVPLSLKQRVAKVVPMGLVEVLDRLMFGLRRSRIRFTHWFFGLLGQNVVGKKDYYSTLPVLSELKANRARWERPSDLVGVEANVNVLSKTLGQLADSWEEEFRRVAGDHAANSARGFGPGYPAFDARTLYYKVREAKPQRYLEVGSGLSTYYASIAAQQNAADGSPMSITCIEPYPYDALRTIEGFDLIEGFVQDVPVERFEELEAGDVLFIDSSHALKIDSDVAYLFLEVLPRIKPGVLVHIHDVHFPYNTPFPADTWIFGERPPVYWQEAMVVQAFLAFNSAFEVQLSTPMVRHYDEQFLLDRFEDYTPLRHDPNPPSSLWLQRVG